MNQSFKIFRAIFCILSACAVFLAAQAFFQPFTRHVTAASAMQAQANQWRGIGPYGGHVRHLKYHPANANLVFAAVGALGNTIYKSIDGGANWTIASNGLPGTEIADLALHPTNQNILYAAVGLQASNQAGQKDGLYKSGDGGATWSRIPITGAPTLPVTCIGISPTQPSRIYIGGSTGGAFRSNDDGATWTSLPGLPSFARIEVSWSDPNVFYAASQGNRIAKSTDGGVSWLLLSEFRANITDITITDLAIDPTNQNILYVTHFQASGANVFKTVDGGASWVTANTGLATDDTNRIVISRSNPQVLYLADLPLQGSPRVFKTTNGGGNWTQIGPNVLNGTRALAVNPTNANGLLVGQFGNGIARSTDGGATFTPSNAGLSGFDLKSVAFNSTSPGTIYAGANYLSLGLDTVYRTTNGGNAWEPSNNDIPSTDRLANRLETLAIHPSNANNVYAGRYNTFWRSSNGAMSWAPTTGFGDVTMVDMKVHSSNPNIIYVGFPHISPIRSGLYRSTDGGASFAIVPHFLDSGTNAIALHPTSTNVVYATRFGILQKTTDGGVTWSLTGLGNTVINRLAIGTDNPNILYALAGSLNDSYFVGTHTLYKSTDAGATWVEVNDGLALHSAESIAINPANSNHVLLGVQAAGVYETKDGGSTWAALNAGLTSSSIRELVFNNAGTLARAATSAGVFEITFAGSSCIAPTVQIGPGVQIVCEGTSWTFTATVGQGTAPLTYVWRKDGQVIAGATGANLSGTGTVAEAGNYQVTVTNACGTAVSTNAPGTLTIRSLSSIAPTTVSVPATASTGTINGVANANDNLCTGIQATTNVAWIRITGQTRIGFTYAIDANTGAARTGIITLRNSTGTTTTRTINQAAGTTTCTYSINPTGVTSPPVPAAGGNGTVAVTTQAGCAWTAITNVPWIAVTSDASGTGNGTVGYAVAANTGVARAAAINIAGLSFTINQAAGSTGGAQDVVWTELANAQLFGNVLRKVGGATDGTWDGRAVSQQSIASGEASLEFTVSGTNVYRAIGLSNDLPSGNPDQLDYAVYLTNISLAEFRENGAYRGDATIKNGDVIRIELKAGKVSFYVNGLLLALAVNAPKYPLKVVALFSQPGGEIANAKLSGLSGGSCTYSLAPTAETITAAAFSSGTTLLTQGGCAWTATSNASWLTITSATSGTGSAEIRYQASANAGASRTGTITVGGQTLTVTQGAGNQTCTYALSPTSANVSAAESTGTVSVTTQAGCAWVANSVNTPWLEGVGGNTFIGSGRFGYRVLANATTTQRVGTFNVSPLGLPSTGVNFVVTQAGAATGGNGVRWTNFVNTAVVGDILRKTGGASDGRFDGWAQSEQSFASGEFYLEFTASGTFAARSAGLSDAAPSGDLNGLDYEVRFTGTNVVEFRERGAYRGDVVYKNGDVFRVAVEGGKVNFYVNGVVLAQSVTAPPYPLRAVVLFSNIGGEISAAKLFNGRPPVTSAARQTTTGDLPCRDCVTPLTSPSRSFLLRRNR